MELGKALSRVNIGRTIEKTRMAEYGDQFKSFAATWLNPDAADGDRAEEVMEAGQLFLINGPDAHEGALCLLKAFVVRRQPVFCLRAPNVAKFWREHGEEDWGTMARDARVLGLVPFFEPAFMPGPMSKEDQADTEDFLLREIDDARCMVFVSAGDYRTGWWSDRLCKVIAEKAHHMTAVKGR